MSAPSRGRPSRALPLGRHRRSRSMRATTTRSGACPRPTTARCSRSWCWRASSPGLSWLTILRKRENFRRAFHGFEPERIARYGAKDIARLMADAGIVRNRLKIEATIDNARALLKLQKRTSLAGFLWGFLDGRPQINRHSSFKTVPAETPTSKAISKALKAEGFRFVGPTTIYAFMQATGMVNDHLVELPSPRPLRRAAATVQGARAAQAKRDRA